LEELNLFWNNVGEAGAEALAGALRHTPRLRKLNLAWNSLGNAGAVALAEALKDTPDLAELSVAWGGIGNPGAVALAGALRHVPGLRELRVRWNAFGETGSAAFARAVAALEEASPGARVMVSGIPWPTLEAARNGTMATSGEPALPQHDAQPPRLGQEGANEASTSTCRPPSVDAVTCATHRCSALVVGNANYTRGALPSEARRDAKDVAAALERMGFQVSRLLDGTRRQMKSAAKAFFKSIEPGGVAFLYFIGHGFQLDGANRLLPVDYPVEKGVEAFEKAVALSWLLQGLRLRKATASLVVLDACRPGPFRAKAVVEGLAPVAAPLGGLIALAAAPSTVRWLPAGTTESASLYTQHLVRQMSEPNLQVEEVFKRLRRQLINQTGGRQVPWESSSLVADVVPNAQRAAEAYAAWPSLSGGEL